MAVSVSSDRTHVEHDERVEASERRSRASGIGQRGEWVSACDEQDAQRPAFDLVGEGDARELAEPAAQLGAGCRTGLGGDRGCVVAAVLRPGALVEREEPSLVAPHPAVAVDGAGHDQQHPAQPFRHHAVAAHGHAGAAHRRQLARGSYR